MPSLVDIVRGGGGGDDGGGFQPIFGGGAQPDPRRPPSAPTLPGQPTRSQTILSRRLLGLQRTFERRPTRLGERRISALEGRLRKSAAQSADIAGVFAAAQPGVVLRAQPGRDLPARPPPASAAERWADRLVRLVQAGVPFFTARELARGRQAMPFGQSALGFSEPDWAGGGPIAPPASGGGFFGGLGDFLGGVAGAPGFAGAAGHVLGRVLGSGAARAGAAGAAGALGAEGLMGLFGGGSGAMFRTSERIVPIREFAQIGPDGRCYTWRYAGRPVLFSGDIAAARRVARIARRAGRARPRARRFRR